MPTGVPVGDARGLLFDAAEEVLLREGPDALTSRAVTDRAHLAKGVLHRHFADFDQFLCELVVDRAERTVEEGTRLRLRAGTRTVEENLTSSLRRMFSPVAVAMIPLITFRDELRNRLRQARPGGGVVVLSDIARSVALYLAAELHERRISADADLDSLALSIVGGAHMLYAERRTPDPAAVRRMVTAVLADVHGRPVR